MKKNDIVKLVTIGLAAVLLPMLLAIPTIHLNLETLVSLGAGLAVFYIITCLTARTGYKKYISLVPVVLALVIGISYIPINLSGWQLFGYYTLVIIALILSVGSHLLVWIKSGSSKFKKRHHRRAGDEDDE